VNNRRRVVQLLGDRRLVDEEQEFTGQKVVQKLFKEVAPKFADRPGGYTRIIKTADFRIGDAGDIVVLSLTDETTLPTGTVRRSAGLRRKRNEKRHQFASKALKAGTKADKSDKAESAEAGA